MSRNPLQRTGYRINILETSACIEYAINGNYRRSGSIKTFKSNFNDKVSEFVSKCNEIWFTDIIKNEARNVLSKAVNILFDEKFGEGNQALLRSVIISQAMERLNQLFNDSTCKDVEDIDTAAIYSFYNNLYATPEGMRKLEELKIRKRVNYWMPETNDIIILAEAVELLKKELLCLISGDGHFTEFKDEILADLNLTIFDFYDLHHVDHPVSSSNETA